MHAIINGKDAEYVHLEPKPGGHLILKDGTRYTFDVIGMPYYTCDAPDRNNNLIEVERLAYGAGKWMLGNEAFFESLGDIQKRAWLQFDRYRAEQGFPRIPWDVFVETVRESDQLWFAGQSEKEAAIVQETNSEFFGRRYARHWGLARLLREHENSSLQRDVCAAAWFEGSSNPLLLRDFSEINVRNPFPRLKEDNGQKYLRLFRWRNAGKPPSERQQAKLAPPDVNDTLVWHVEQKIRDELDAKRKAVPSHSEVFVRYCRDRMKLVDMQRKFRWKYRTLKARKAALECFLWKNFGLTLDAFFVDRRIFAAAERQLEKDYCAKRISRRALGEGESDQDDE